jgi:hypothetical protein
MKIWLGLPLARVSGCCLPLPAAMPLVTRLWLLSPPGMSAARGAEVALVAWAVGVANTRVVRSTPASLAEAGSLLALAAAQCPSVLPGSGTWPTRKSFGEELPHTDGGSHDGSANNHGKRYGEVLRVVEECQDQARESQEKQGSPRHAYGYPVTYRQVGDTFG